MPLDLGLPLRSYGRPPPPERGHRERTLSRPSMGGGDPARAWEAEIPPEPPGRTWEADSELIRRVVEAADGRLIVMGTDGGADSFGTPRFRRAGWGVAIGEYATGGKCQGTDASAFAGEAQALLQALRALNGAAKFLEAGRGVPELTERVLIFIDNMAVVNSTKAAIRRGGLPRNAAGIWAEVRELAQRVPGLEIHRVPSHGKKKAEWRPPDGIDGGVARYLNDKADTEATRYAKLACEDVETQRMGHLEAERWASRVHSELERRSGEMIAQNARYFKRRRRRAQGVGDQLSESDDPDGDEPEDPDDRGDGPPGGGPPGGGPPGGAPPVWQIVGRSAAQIAP